jgi:protein-L-isoaspartate(D-aspartate) O-methyltransferase
MVGDPRAVIRAFELVPRAGFLPAGARLRAEYDGPLNIGHGQTNSQPRTVADMLVLLDVEPGHLVLDVGSGSGWTTALLAVLVGKTGAVHGVELEPDLVAFGRANIAAYPNASITMADPDVLGLPDLAPYDRILVSAEPRVLPQALVDQLGPDGRMVIPVAGRMLLVERSGDEVAVSEHGYYRFVPLR